MSYCVVCSVGGLISYCVVCSIGGLMSHCVVCVVLFLYGSLPPVV
jgi:CHASE2 domain-containing sensor protein